MDKMEGDYHGQRWTAWFLWKEGVKTADIHKRLTAVCGQEGPAQKTVYNWIAGFASGRESATKNVSTGRPSTSRSPNNIAIVSGLIMADRRITFDELESQTGLGRATLHTIIHDDLDMKKVCAHWVPRDLTQAQKENRVEVCRRLLQMQNDDPEFLEKLVTGDESWCHYHTPEKKIQSMQWKHPGSPRPKKFRSAPSAGKQMISVFWDTCGILLMDWLPQGTTVNSRVYCDTLTRLRRRIQQRRKGKWSKGVLLQHDNARPHTSNATTAKLTSLGFVVVPHPPYSPDLAPSDYALFDNMKDALRGKRFDNDELQEAVREWVRSTPKQWFHDAIMKLPGRWQRCIDVGGEYIEKSHVH